MTWTQSKECSMLKWKSYFTKLFHKMLPHVKNDLPKRTLFKTCPRLLPSAVGAYQLLHHGWGHRQLIGQKMKAFHPQLRSQHGKTCIWLKNMPPRDKQLSCAAAKAVTKLLLHGIPIHQNIQGILFMFICNKTHTWPLMPIKHDL